MASLIKCQIMELKKMLDSDFDRIGVSAISGKLNQLSSFVDSSLKQQGCNNREKVVDEFCMLAARYRLKIFDITRSNKNINHPAKDVISALKILSSKIEKFKEQNEWRHDCCEMPHGPLDKFVFLHLGDGCVLNAYELNAIAKELEFACVKENKYDDDFFKKFIRITFVNLLCDLLKLAHQYYLKIKFSNDIDVIDKKSLFFVLLMIFEFCEGNFNGKEFCWLPWVREKSSCQSLGRLLLNRLDAIRGGKSRPGIQIKIPYYSDVNSVEPVAYEAIGIDGAEMIGDLYALFGIGEFDDIFIRDGLPDFSTKYS